MLLDIQKPDFRHCATCCQWVPLEPFGMKCLCELVRENHLAAVHAHRQLIGAPPASCLYRSSNEQGLPDIDTQDMPIPMPRFPIRWSVTIPLCLMALFLAALFVHAIDGATKTANVEMAQTETRR